MSVTPLEIVNKQLTTTATDVPFVSQTGTRTRITAASIINTEAATNYTATIYKIPSGDTAGAANIIINARTIVGGETYPCPELIGQILEPGDKLQGIASTTLKLNFIVSGVEITP